LEIEHDTGINTGIPVVVFYNTEIPVLPNVVGIGGPNCNCLHPNGLQMSLPIHVALLQHTHTQLFYGCSGFCSGLPG